MFERYTERARRVLFFARYEASQLGSNSIETEHLLLGLIREGKGLTSRIFARSHLSLENIRKEIEGRTVFREKVSTSVEMPFSAETKRVLQFAAEEADRLLHNYIGTEHLLLGILREERSVAASILMEKGMRLNTVREDIVQLLNEKTTLTRVKETPLLAEFSRDLTESAMKNQLDPLVGREHELERVQQVLCRRTKNNAVLIGEPGVGGSSGRSVLPHAGDHALQLRQAPVEEMSAAGKHDDRQLLRPRPREDVRERNDLVLLAVDHDGVRGHRARPRSARRRGRRARAALPSRAARRASARTCRTRIPRARAAAIRRTARARTRARPARRRSRRRPRRTCPPTARRRGN